MSYTSANLNRPTVGLRVHSGSARLSAVGRTTRVATRLVLKIDLVNPADAARWPLLVFLGLIAPSGSGSPRFTTRVDAGGDLRWHGSGTIGRCSLAVPATALAQDLGRA